MKKAVTVHHWDEATAFVIHDVVISPNFRQMIPLPSLHPRVDGLLFEGRDLLWHFLLFFVAARNHRSSLILVRGFRTKMLMIALPMLLFFRKKLLFIVHHNVQWAHISPIERGFKLLCRLGLRFGFLEGADGLAELGVEDRNDQFVTVPLPVYPELPAAGRCRSSSDTLKVGVIGRALPEKNTDALMTLLLDWRASGALSAEIVLGSDDREVLQVWGEKGATTWQTFAYEDYLRALLTVDVLLINYSRQHYYFRSSGVIHEAVYVGTAVVCPDFPVFRRQVTEPAPVGAVYRDPESMLAAIRDALEIARSKPHHFERWREARSPREFSRRIDAFIERQR